MAGLTEGLRRMPKSCMKPMYINKVLLQQYDKSIHNRNKNLKLKYLNRDCAIATKAQKNPCVKISTSPPINHKVNTESKWF